MTWEALYLELVRVNGRLRRYATIWLSVWGLAVLCAVPVVSDQSNSFAVAIFLIASLTAIAVSFLIQPAFFREWRRRQQLAAEVQNRPPPG